MTQKLSEHIAFKTMVMFLKDMHEKLGWNDLPPLLGSMVLVDGKPLDPAIADDWKRAVNETIKNSFYPETPSDLTIDQAYFAVVHFLNAQFKKGSFDVKKILQELQSVDSVSDTNSLTTEWKQCTAMALDTTKPINAVVVKNGVTYEIHNKSDGES